MNSEDGQGYSVCILQFSCITNVCGQNINKQNVNIKQTKLLQITAFSVGITMLIHNKDDIQFVTEFPYFLGHPVYSNENYNTIRRLH